MILFTICVGVVFFVRAVNSFNDNNLNWGWWAIFFIPSYFINNNGLFNSNYKKDKK